MKPIQSMIAVLFALGSASALAQNAATPQPTTGKPVSDSASYGPVLGPQSPTPATTERPTSASTLPAGEAGPMAQEERAGKTPVTNQQDVVDPSARPAPVNPQPQTRPLPQTRTQQMQPKTQQELKGQPERQQQTGKQAQRRPGAVQRIEPTPRIAAPTAAPMPSPRAGVPATPNTTAPRSSQVVACVGGTCTDADGRTYNASGTGNTVVSSDGRLCTTNGANVQCL